MTVHLALSPSSSLSLPSLSLSLFRIEKCTRCIQWLCVIGNRVHNRGQNRAAISTYWEPGAWKLQQVLVAFRTFLLYYMYYWEPGAWQLQQVLVVFRTHTMTDTHVCCNINIIINITFRSRFINKPEGADNGESLWHRLYLMHRSRVGKTKGDHGLNPLENRAFNNIIKLA